MAKTKKCYITTPIYYSSGNVHVGNTYTTIAADILARFYRMSGYDTWYLTGMDEHGQKIEEAATKASLTPQQLVDSIAEQTSNLWKKLLITNDDFLCTSQVRHKKVVQAIFEQLLKQDDIYLGTYSGDYCVSCETYYTKSQLGENGTCPDCGKPTRILTEESYFLRMSKYQDRLLEHIKNHPDFIQPVTRKNEVVAFIEAGLDDLCVSRTTFSWGISVKSNPKHVVYVWIDALTNYISALGYLGDDEKYQKYWVENHQIMHLLGKDILRFHAIIWPIMLMALQIPLNQKIYVHGWLLSRDGKMSKSRGNMVYPMDVVSRYGVDALRYYLAKEMPLGNDGLFSSHRFIERYNSELVNDLGNLVSRVIAMVNKYRGGVIPSKQAPISEYSKELVTTCQEVIEQVPSLIGNFQLQNAVNKIWVLISRANKYIDETTPWTLAKDETNKQQLDNVLYDLCETIRIVALLLSPILVETSPIIYRSLGLDEKMMSFQNIAFGYQFTSCVSEKVEHLFSRLDVEKELAYFDSLNDETKEDVKTEKKITIDDFKKIDLQVGEIIEGQIHPKADKLLVLKVKINKEIRTIVSGIANNYQIADLIGKKVTIVTNLQPAQIRGITSEGMLLCASFDKELEIIELKNAPSGAKIS